MIPELTHHASRITQHFDTPLGAAVDDYQLALAHYRLQFPDEDSLGEEAVTWRTEYNRVSASGLSATLVVSTGLEGSTVGAARNFPQKTLLSALHTRRAELDADYLATLTAPSPIIAQPAGSVIRLGY